ncbi:MAG: hypothetical protein ACLTBV_11425 [Enterocloster bolteae]
MMLEARAHTKTENVPVEYSGFGYVYRTEILWSRPNEPVSHAAAAVFPASAFSYANLSSAANIKYSLPFHLQNAKSSRFPAATLILFFPKREYRLMEQLMINHNIFFGGTAD